VPIFKGRGGERKGWGREEWEGKKEVGRGKKGVGGVGRKEWAGEGGEYAPLALGGWTPLITVRVWD